MDVLRNDLVLEIFHYARSSFLVSILFALLREKRCLEEVVLFVSFICNLLCEQLWSNTSNCVLPISVRMNRIRQINSMQFTCHVFNFQDLPYHYLRMFIVSIHERTLLIRTKQFIFRNINPKIFLISVAKTVSPLKRDMYPVQKKTETPNSIRLN